MKILIVQDRLRSGGTERQSVLLANAFAASGHDTTLLTFRPGGALAATVAPGVRRVALQFFDTTFDWFAPRLSATARRSAPDVILCMGRMANCYAAQLANEVPPARVVATMRTGKSIPWLFRRSLRRADHIVANSREARDTLVRHHRIAAEKISVIYNSLVFPPASAVAAAACRSAAADALRTQYHAANATLVLLCVAMFRPEKNQRELIEIASTLPSDIDWQLWLAGDGPARAACEQLVAQKGLAARVTFLGFQRDPSPLYAAADVAVHASSSESLSNFFIEAQAHGLPAVAYAAQGIGETFVPEHTGWVIPRGDRAAFRAAIERLAAASSAERAARSAEARAFARTTFDPARQVAAYVDLFSRLVRAT